MKQYQCDLAETGKCQYGGTKAFNYGFMRGSHAVCRHPVHRLHDGKARPIYPMLMDGPIECPLKKETPTPSEPPAEGAQT